MTRAPTLLDFASRNQHGIAVVSEAGRFVKTTTFTTYSPARLRQIALSAEHVCALARNHVYATYSVTMSRIGVGL